LPVITSEHDLHVWGFSSHHRHRHYRRRSRHHRTITITTTTTNAPRKNNNYDACSIFSHAKLSFEILGALKSGASASAAFMSCLGPPWTAALCITCASRKYATDCKRSLMLLRLSCKKYDELKSP
jgi:hypothetical protein